MYYRLVDHDKFFSEYKPVSFKLNMSKKFETRDDRDTSDTGLGTLYSEYFSNVQDSAELNLSSTVAGGLIESMTGDREQSGAGANYFYVLQRI